MMKRANSASAASKRTRRTTDLPNRRAEEQNSQGENHAVRFVQRSYVSRQELLRGKLTKLNPWKQRAVC